MAKEEQIRVKGKIIEAIRDKFLVEVNFAQGDSDAILSEITCTIGGKVRKLRFTVGDFVNVEISPYDLTKGRIKYRLKDNDSHI